jgi:hypothetical protein
MNNNSSLKNKRTRVTSTLLTPLTPIFIFVALLLIATGTSTIGSISITSIVLLQWLAGSLLWSTIKMAHRPSMLESIALGAPIGFALCTVFDQMFVLTPLRPIAWLIPVTLIFVASIRSKTINDVTEHAEVDLQLIAISIVGLLVGMSGIYFVYLIGIIPMLLCVVALFFFRFKSLMQRMFCLLTGIVFSVIAIASLTISTGLSSVSLLGPLIYDSDDHIFSEQMSWSIAHWGLVDNSSAVGTTIQYHWFSLAWSGLVSRASGAGPWIVNAHLIPIISFLVLSLLLIAVSQRKQKRIWLALLSPLCLLLADDYLTPLKFYFTGVPTNILSHIWLLSAALLFVCYPSEKSMKFRLIFALLSAATILGKGPYGIVLLFGLLFAITYALFSKKLLSRSSIITTAMVGIFILISSYIVFLREPSGRSYIVSWYRFRTNIPNPLITRVPQGGIFAFVIGVAFIVIFLFMRYLVPIYFGIKKNVFPVQTFFFIGCTCAGLISFVLYYEGSTTYFVNAALVTGVLSLIFYLTHTDELLFAPGVTRNKLVLRFTLFVILYFVLRIILSQFEFFINRHGYDKDTFVYLIPFSLFLLIALFDHLRRFGKRITLLSGLTIFIFMNGFYFVQKIDFSVPYYSQETVAKLVPPGESDAMIWLSDNVPIDAIIATNRSLCSDQPHCTDLDGRTLVSALSRRRVLLDGRHTGPFNDDCYAVGELNEAIKAKALNQIATDVSTDGCYQPWELERVNASLNFIHDPNNETLSVLKSFDVDFVYIQKSPGIPLSWKPWGATVYENKSAIILDIHLSE